MTMMAKQKKKKKKGSVPKYIIFPKDKLQQELETWDLWVERVSLQSRRAIHVTEN